MNPALEILKIPTAPGHEDMVAGFVCSWLRRLAIPFHEDCHGNLIAEFQSHSKRPAVAFAVHMDHPGFEVAHVSKNGVECVFLGSVPSSYIQKGTEVELFDSLGNLRARASVVHVVRWERRHKRVLLKKTAKLVDRGLFGMWRLPALQLVQQKTKVVGRACDDLAGCAAVLAALAELVKTRAWVHVYAIFTRREEIGLEGAFEVAYSKRLPKSVPVISIEASKALSNARQGDGPILRVGDYSSIFDPALTHALQKVGRTLQEQRGFSLQRKLMDGGICEATAYLQTGYIAGGLCVALGNYHNCSSNGKIAAENIHLGDWQNLVRLMVQIAKFIKK